MALPFIWFIIDVSTYNLKRINSRFMSSHKIELKPFGQAEDFNTT